MTWGQIAPCVWHNVLRPQLVRPIASDCNVVHILDCQPGGLVATMTLASTPVANTDLHKEGNTI